MGYLWIYFTIFCESPLMKFLILIEAFDIDLKETNFIGVELQ